MEAESSPSEVADPYAFVGTFERVESQTQRQTVKARSAETTLSLLRELSQSCREAREGKEGIKEGSMQEVLNYASFWGMTDTAVLMYYLGQDVNAQDSRQETAIHWAARGGRTETAKKLVTLCNAQPNVKSSRGQTPMQVAEECEARETVHELRALVRKTRQQHHDISGPRSVTKSADRRAALGRVSPRK
eukprot:Hpha_TRINITY_DN22265_c0_g1::TRINITY_DN22265_c0_g1_i1::g.167119::m.167119